MQLSTSAWFKLPFPESIGEPWLTILIPLYVVPPFVFMMMLSLLAAFFPRWQSYNVHGSYLPCHFPTLLVRLGLSSGWEVIGSKEGLLDLS